MRNSHGRNDGLDLARAAAVVMVFADHAGGLLLKRSEPSSPLDHLLDLFGGYGVNLFFALSGFLIGQILIRLFDRDVSLRGLGGFWMRRWMRTLPLYYAVILYLCYYTNYIDYRALFFMQNFQHAGGRNVLNVSWSLVLEEYFYLFFPLLLFQLARLTRLRGAALAAVLSITLIIVCAAARIYLNLSDPTVMDHSFRDHPFLRLDCAAWGVLAACARIAWSRKALAWFRVPALVPAIAIALTVAQMWLFIRKYDVAFEVATHFWAWNYYYEATQYSVASAVFAALVLSLSLQLPVIAGWAGRVIRFISLRSYSIYLLHVPILLFVMPQTLAALGPLPRLAAWAVIVLAAASITYQCIEKPFLWMRDNASRRRSARLF